MRRLVIALVAEIPALQRGRAFFMQTLFSPDNRFTLGFHVQVFFVVSAKLLLYFYSAAINILSLI